MQVVLTLCKNVFFTRLILKRVLFYNSNFQSNLKKRSLRVFFINFNEFLLKNH